MKTILFDVVAIIAAVLCLMIIGDVFASGVRIMLFGLKLTIVPVAVLVLIYVVIHFLWVKKKL